MTHRLSLDHIAQAAQSIDPVFLHTPQFVSEPLSDHLGLELVVKVETLNPIRSFKGRGADYFVQQLTQQSQLPPLVCASAGNFGQAMAYACRKHGLPLRIFAAETANPLKVERMRALGATVHLGGHDFDAAKLQAKAWANQNAAWMVEDGQEAAISEGAGSIAVELLKLPPLDSVLIPLGNGALLGGMARWIKAHSPHTQVIAVQAAGAPAMWQSLQQKRLIQSPSIHTIADGIGVRLPIPQALQDLEGLVDGGVLVQEESLLAAMKLGHQHLGLVLEPSGAAGLAALLEHPGFRGQRVATVLCGGNLSPQQMQDWLYR